MRLDNISVSKILLDCLIVWAKYRSHQCSGVNNMNAFTGQTFQMNQIINLKEVIQFTGLSRATIYNIIDERHKQYDATFPKQAHLTVGRVGWSAWEVNQWIESKLANREEWGSFGSLFFNQKLVLHIQSDYWLCQTVQVRLALKSAHHGYSACFLKYLYLSSNTGYHPVRYTYPFKHPTSFLLVNTFYIFAKFALCWVVLHCLMRWSLQVWGSQGSFANVCLEYIFFLFGGLKHFETPSI